ncbi:MAG TPA: uroporphyrinogen decarboxylase family protein [Bacteroidota bacterium]|nr:uroporphyrinogen decarboxylase family protein [Bacteroidota bacterium]
MENRFLRALRAERPDRVPFVPAVYEHKAWFIGRTPSEVCREGPRLLESVVAEFEALRADAIVVGIDVYNVEAEACGCAVTYFDPPDTSIPSLAPGSELFSGGAFPAGLAVPDPHRSGRMPLMIDATERAVRAIGSHAEVMGALSAPFSLAASLMGPANLFMAIAAEPEAAHRAIAFAAQVVIAYGMEYARRGITAALFDSQASPGLISPRSYGEFVLAPTRHVIRELTRGGMKYVPLVIGGNTDPIVESYIRTGGNYILCDGGATVESFLPACRSARRAFRRNIPASFLLSASVAGIQSRVREEIASAAGYGGFILGTGIVPYGIPTEKIEAARPDAR